LGLVVENVGEVVAAGLELCDLAAQFGRAWSA
jgi:hypothetical protein